MSEIRTKVGTFIPNIEYIKRMRGAEGVELTLKELRKRGYNYDFRRMRHGEWVPIEVRKEFLYAVRDALDWDDRRIFAMGARSPTISPVFKIFMGVIIDIKKILDYSPELWKKHYSGGTLAFEEFRPGYARLTLRDFDVDPLLCKYLEGYFLGVLKLAKVKNPKVKETKCTFRGDEYHEYTGTWDT